MYYGKHIKIYKQLQKYVKEKRDKNMQGYKNVHV